ncbi:hypothetical protein MVEN_02516900 [Mycena venus]|uniref:Uncharacterized protein n=1 Tax=Mycena venus TaxID=2733690 RepID=A0A8H7CA86_9AGAR|nr:hypothetical protein MVEN_02516900 [Mycena venus]
MSTAEEVQADQVNVPRWKPMTMQNKPTWVLPSPFERYNGGQYGNDEWGPRPLTVFELTMYELSWALRSKPDWQRKAADPEIRRKWRQEALEQQAASAEDDAAEEDAAEDDTAEDDAVDDDVVEDDAAEGDEDDAGEEDDTAEDDAVEDDAAEGDEDDEDDDSSEVRLTEKMIDYVLAELDGYAKIADNTRGIERACFEAIWYSDRLVPEDVLERLKNAAKALEDVSEDKKDWHPGSKKQVLDLVHPSLYCVVYGRTHAYLPGKPRIAANFLPLHASAPLSNQAWTSQDFSWMPSDFTVASDGSVKLASPYINNLHPVIHRPLYGAIEEVLTAFVPLFERVLGDANRENGREPFSDTQRLERIGCIWGPGGQPYPEDDPPSDEDEDEWNEKFLAKIPKILPEAKDYAGEVESRFVPVSLRGRTIQCIIKLANIHLTPEQPKYEGGSWHVEGMVNESIVASGIYYYDEENITESRLSFRVAVGEPDYHGQDDGDCMRMLYDMHRDSELIQDLGAVVTKAGRTLSWSNLFQHCVSPFELADPSKPGHRKILAFFLVDPTKDPIVSATDVPPQQAEWAGEAFEEACADPASVLGALPQELKDLVKGHFPATVMTLKEAEAYRLELMKERTASVADHTHEYVQTFNMCEH